MSQSPVGVTTPADNGSVNGAKQPLAGKFQPVVPKWFLDNVKTSDEVQELKPRLKFVDDGVPNERQSTGKDFGIDRLEIADLLDVTAALHNIPSPLNPATRPQAVILLSKMRLGYDFLDQVVVKIAQEMRCSLITLTFSELGEIADDFLCQRDLYLKEHSGTSENASKHSKGDEDNKPVNNSLQYFFGSQSRLKADKTDTDRNLQAVSAILDSAKTRMGPPSGHHSLANPDEPPSLVTHVDDPGVILYVRYPDDDTEVLVGKILFRIRDAFKERRMAGQKVTLVLGLAHTEANEDDISPSDHNGSPWLQQNCPCHRCEYENNDCCDDYPCLFRRETRKLTDLNLSTFVLDPKSVPVGWPDKRRETWPPSLTTANVQSFKRHLRANLPEVSLHPPVILDAEFDWTTVLANDTLKAFGLPQSSPMALVVNMARKFAVGTGLRHANLNLSDIESAFHRAHSAAIRRGLIHRRPANAEESTSDEKNMEPTWQQKMDAIKSGCNGQELELLSNVVNPEALRETHDDIEVGEDVLQVLSRLVSQGTASATSALSRNARITGALLYGPPGTGKTLLARVLAKRTATSMIMLDSSSVSSKWIGETEKSIAAAFSLGRKLFPSIIFIDEVDALFFRRSSSDSNWHRQAINQFLQSMDGVIQGDDAPFVLGATNQPLDLDSAFLRRLPYHVEFRLPNFDARARILRMILRGEQLDRNLDIDKLAATTKGFSGSDLKSLCAQAFLACSFEQDPGSESQDGVPHQVLANRHFLKAFEMTHASVSSTDMQSILRFKELHATSMQTAAMRGRLDEARRSGTVEADHASLLEAESPETGAEEDSEGSSALLSTRDDEKARRLVHGSPAKMKAHRESDLYDQDVDADTRSDAEQREPVVVRARPQQQRDDNYETTPSLTDPVSKLVPIPVIQPPPDCLNRERKVYPYQRLPTSRSIRLLRVSFQQSLGSDHLRDPVHCALLVVSPDDNPDYFALSYTWGDPRTIHTDRNNVLSREHWGAPAFEIFCDDIPVSVPANLYAAITGLRMHFAIGSMASQFGDKYLPQGPNHFDIWIDAICINQDDLSEKSQQVPLMSQIYGSCRCVLMWLGGSERLIDKYWATTSHTLNKVMEKLRVLDPVLGELFDILDKSSYIDLGLEPLLEGPLLGWYLLVSRSWFSRAWVVQEWALAPNAAMLCGHILIDPLEFTRHLVEVQVQGWKGRIEHMIYARINGPLHNKDDPEGHYFAGLLNWDGEHCPGRLWTAEEDAHKEPISPSITQQIITLRAMLYHDSETFSVQQSLYAMRMKRQMTISEFRQLRCSDPRDKVYAFHGLFINEDGSAVFQAPDYTKTVSDVYLDVSKVIFSQVGIRILCEREVRHAFSSELPSWALDLRENDYGAFNTRTKHYMVSQGMKQWGHARLEGTNVAVNGYHVETIRRQAMLPDNMCDHDFTELFEILSSLPAISYFSNQSKGNPQMPAVEMVSQDRYEVLWRTLLFDESYSYTYPLPPWLGAHYLGALQIELRTRMERLNCAVFYRLLLPMAKGSEEIVDRSNCTGSALLGGVTKNQCCETCALKAELSVMIKTEGVAVSDPDDAAELVLDCFAAISKFRGDVPFDSFERPEPPFWQEHVRLVRKMRRLARVKDDLYAVTPTYLRMRNIAESITKDSSAFKAQIPRSLFSTSEGRLGTTSGPIQAGDQIWVLAGMHFPVILRDAGGGRHHVIQCAYVHGIMHGEAVPVSEPPTLVTLV